MSFLFWCLALLTFEQEIGVKKETNLLTISPSSLPKSKNKSRVPSSADAFNLSNGCDQITLAGEPKPLSTNEKPRSKCTIN